MFKWFRNKGQHQQKQPSPKSAPRKRARVVQVSYCRLEQELRGLSPAQNEKGYAYFWRFAHDPHIGHRVIVPVFDGELEAAVIVGLGRQGYDGPVKDIARLLTAKEMKLTPEAIHSQAGQ